LKLLTFSTQEGRPRLGVLLDDGRVLDVGVAYKLLFEAKPPRMLRDMRSLIVSGDIGLRLLDLVRGQAVKAIRSNGEVAELLSKNAVHPLESIKFHPPIPNPEKALFVAVNYWSHAREIGIEPPEKPYFFMKLGNTLVAHGDPVIIPRTATKPDHEVELAVIIGKKGKYIDRGTAMDHVFGYTIVNDVSLRDKQAPIPRLGIRWLHAKSFDTGAPIGPWVVTRDEIEDPHNLRLELRVNGEVRQEGSTGDMIFKISELLESASDGVTLKPGDIIATGTPQGVGAATGRFLRDGDVMSASIERVGVLVNMVVFER
jgi:2-keto-4-pentenoate hydratase/2-oxohepta-3-ene-1,7-dioic acid hydratase in catechol pathway